MSPGDDVDQRLSLLAPAKVNLILRVLGRRPDGYHDLWSVMHTVGLMDELTLTLCAAADEIRLDCDHPALPADGRNLVVRAARLVLERAGRRLGVALQLQKRIPIGAGLGGGSSNAAAVIVGLNRLLNLGWTREEMAAVGAELGSDVPFFFFAPAAQVTGRGERVAALQVQGERWLVLIDPGFPVNTARAYATLAATRRAVPPLSEAHRRLALHSTVRWEDIVPLMENDFEAALAPAYPLFEELKRALREGGAEAALLSGSGSTVFGLFVDQTAAERVAGAMRRAGYGAWAVPAATTAPAPSPSVG